MDILYRWQANYADTSSTEYKSISQSITVQIPECVSQFQCTVDLTAVSGDASRTGVAVNLQSATRSPLSPSDQIGLMWKVHNIVTQRKLNANGTVQAVVGMTSTDQSGMKSADPSLPGGRLTIGGGVSVEVAPGVQGMIYTKENPGQAATVRLNNPCQSVIPNFMLCEGQSQCIVDDGLPTCKCADGYSGTRCTILDEQKLIESIVKASKPEDPKPEEVSTRDITYVSVSGALLLLFTVLLGWVFIASMRGM